MSQPSYYTAAAVRELDRLAIEEHGIDGFTLMHRAGRATFEVLHNRWPQARRVDIFCGTGNNGGDGCIVAALAMEAGLQVKVWLAGDAARLRGDAHRALQYARAREVAIRPAGQRRLATGADTVIIDALLGTGLDGPVRSEQQTLIETINDSGLPVLALDIPSGLSADSGQVMGAAVRADATVTFIGRKIGQVSGQGPKHCGALFFSDLDVPAEIYRWVAPVR